MERRPEFKISLVYFGLYSEDESVSRVIHRVQTGGHDVADDVIRFRSTFGRLPKQELPRRLEERAAAPPSVR